jgi:ADP-heptose:LPS heptosyltransferase
VSAHLWSPRPARIVVFRALALGDMLCAVPALRALRAFLPRAHITLAALPWAESFVHRFRAYVDELLPFPGYPGYPEQDGPIEGFLDFLAVARASKFDVAIQLHGSGGMSNRVVSLMGARHMAGFRPAGAPADPSLGPWMMPWPDSQPEIHRYLSLMAFLGVPLRGEELELPLEAADWQAYESLARAHHLEPGGYVCVHPGARLASRRWPPERFAEVAAAITREGYPIVLTGSPAEAALTAVVRQRLRAAIDLTGQTSLGSMAALVSRSALLVCNDTGVSHIAAAVGAPSVVVASGSDVRRWAPLDAARHPVLWHDMPCRPCAHESCPLERHGCALGVSVESVVAQSLRLLQEKLPHAA